MLQLSLHFLNLSQFSPVKFFSISIYQQMNSLEENGHYQMENSWIAQ